MFEKTKLDVTIIYCDHTRNKNLLHTSNIHIQLQCSQPRFRGEIVSSKLKQDRFQTGIKIAVRTGLLTIFLLKFLYKMDVIAVMLFITQNSQNEQNIKYVAFFFYDKVHWVDGWVVWVDFQDSLLQSPLNVWVGGQVDGWIDLLGGF